MSTHCSLYTIGHYQTVPLFCFRIKLPELSITSSYLCPNSPNSLIAFNMYVAFNSAVTWSLSSMHGNGMFTFLPPWVKYSYKCTRYVVNSLIIVMFTFFFWNFLSNVVKMGGPTVLLVYRRILG